MRQVLPARLRARVDAVEVAPLPTSAAPVDAGVLLAVTAAVRAREVLRFDYASPTALEDEDRPPRRIEPHAVVSRGGRWYLLGWDPAAPVRDGAGSGEWRTHRLDRMTPRTPSGPRFSPREVPGGDPAAFVAALFRGSRDPGESGAWPCEGRVVVNAPATEVAPYLVDGAVEALDDDHCRVTAGAWSWTGLAASLLRLGADIEVERPPELARAFAELAERCAAAGRQPPPGRTKQRPQQEPRP